MPIDLYPNISKVKRNGAWQNLPGFVAQSGDADIEAMLANKETSTTAQFAHAKDSFFILNDVLYQADANISVNGTIAVGTNCHVAVLGDEVYVLINETGDLNNALMDNITPLLNNGSIIPVKTFVQGSPDGTGNFVVSARRICSDYGYFPAGTKFNVVCNGQYLQVQFFTGPLESSGNSYAADPISWVGGNTTYKFTVPTGSYVSITVANGYNYGASTDIAPSDFAMDITVSSIIGDKINDISNNLNSASIDYKIISDGKLLNHQTYGYRDASGVTDAYRTEMFPCTDGTVFKYYGRCDYNYDAVQWRNADKRPLGRAQTDHEVGEYTFTAPTNARYVEFSSYGTPNFNVWIDNQKQVGNTKRLIDTTLTSVNPLSSKTLLFVGDSITEGLGYNGGWVSLVQNRNNCTCINEGHGGWPIGNSESEESHYNTLAALVGRKTGTYDYVILSGGYNDFTRSPRADVGSLTPYTYSELTRNTFAGDLEYYIRTARTKWINSKIGFILTMKKEFNDTSVNARQVQYWDLIRNACKKYSIPLLDLYNESGLVGVVVDGVTDLVTTTYYKDADGTHPNTAGYEYLYQKVAEFIKGL